MNILAQILSSRVRAEIFRILFGLLNEPLHMREIERRSGFTTGTVQQELKNLFLLGLVKKGRTAIGFIMKPIRNMPSIRLKALYPDLL